MGSSNPGFCMDEADFIPLSALQHYAFCPRQCALIHLEQVWAENAHTAEGHIMHETAHSGETRLRDGVRIVTDLPLKFAVLGVSGRADVVELHQEGAVLRPYPVEYKKGAPKGHAEADSVQLCAQAICLEEMLDLSLAEGALYYGESHRRRVVVFDAALRQKTAETAQAIHTLFATGSTPPPEERPHCAACSLLEHCLPKLNKDDRASRYLQSLWSAE